MLRCCRELAPRWIKVDSAITRGIARDRRRRAVLRMLARVARDFSVALIAEGIESEEDLDVCFQERVFVAQGHFIAWPREDVTPVSAEFSAWLSARRPPPDEPQQAAESHDSSAIASDPGEPLSPADTETG
jgi:EAL domain-containing protein (putative c-di-GMP-specific phosphodiesterase class I)